MTDLATWRVHVRASNEVFRRDLISRMIARKAFGPIHIFCLCSGMCIEVAVLIEWGFDVVFVHTAISLCDQECNFFVGFVGPHCIHWSIFRTKPGGCKAPGSSTFTACADRLVAEHARCGCFRLLETVPVHPDLTCDMSRQERECGGPLLALNASSVSGPTGRNKRYFIPGSDVSKIERFNHINPDFVVDSGWQFRDKLVPAPVARYKSTKTPEIQIKRSGKREPRFASADERDRLSPVWRMASLVGMAVCLELWMTVSATVAMVMPSVLMLFGLSPGYGNSHAGFRLFSP